MSQPAKFDEKNRKAMQTIKLRMDEMQSYTDRICNQLNMSAAARTAAERVYKQFVCGKRFLFFPRHSDEERRFLRMMIRLALAIDPSLVAKADEVARYYSANYGFEWANSEITATVREEARAMVLSVGESSYGETGTAVALAYVRCHYQTLKHDNVGDFGQTYALAARVQAGGEFNNRHDDWRKELGVDKLRVRREAVLGSEQPSQAEAN